MRIKRLIWSNFRRIPDGSLDVRNHLVLIGPNDTGKSSILRALHMCLGMAHAQLAAAIAPRDFSDPTEPLRLTTVLGDIRDEDRAAFPDEITTGPPETLEVQLEATLDSADGDQRTVRRFFPDSGFKRAPTRAQLRAIGFAFVPAVRSLYRELGGADGTVRSLIANLDLGQDASAVQATLKDYRSALDQAAALRTFRENIASALSGALPKAVTLDDIRIISEADLLDDPLSGAAVTMRDGDHDVPLHEQSDGIRALALLTLLSISHQAAKIVAIDEPETHLHPIGQRAVAHSLQRPAAQRVVATHSPSVVSGVHPLDLVAFGADRRARQLPATASVATFEGMVRYWSYRLIEPLTARHLVVVEGPSDRIMLERVAELAGLDLDRRGIAIFELDGKEQFPFAYRLFGPHGFDLPLLGLLDEDAWDSWAAEVGCPPSDLEKRGYAVCAPDLEGLYVERLGTERVIRALCASPLVGEHSVRAGCRLPLHQIDSTTLIAFCKRRKVDAALALSPFLVDTDIPLLPPLAQLITRLTSN